MRPIDVILGLAELYRRELSDEAQGAWQAVVGDCDVAELREAVRHGMRDWKWMPTPAEVLERMRLARNERQRQRQMQSNQQEHRINWSQAVRSSFNIPNGMRLLDYVEQQLEAGRHIDDIVDEVCEPNRRTA